MTFRTRVSLHQVEPLDGYVELGVVGVEKQHKLAAARALELGAPEMAEQKFRGLRRLRAEGNVGELLGVAGAAFANPLEGPGTGWLAEHVAQSHPRRMNECGVGRIGAPQEFEQ